MLRVCTKEDAQLSWEAFHKKYEPLTATVLSGCVVTESLSPTDLASLKEAMKEGDWEHVIFANEHLH